MHRRRGKRPLRYRGVSDATIERLLPVLRVLRPVAYVAARWRAWLERL